MKACFLSCTLLGWAIALPITSAYSQILPSVSSDSPGITGRGVHSVKCPPSVLRVYLQVSAKGKTLEAALANLEKRRDAIKAQLPKLGGKADTIKFTALDKVDSSEQEQMMDTLRRQMGSDRVPKKLGAPKSVTVNTTFSADWPLSGDTPDKLLLEAEALRKKLIEADLAGVKAAEAEQTPEEREAAEEIQAMMRERYSGGEAQQKPGTPNLAFVGRLSDDKHEMAMAEAFKQAKANAQRIAKAAGASLGPLVRVSGMSDSFYANMMNRQRTEYSPYMRYAQYQQPWQPQIETDENELTSSNPDEIEFHVNVEAVFSLSAK